ncbi:MAG: D-sedoheptulose-7-phosphate isomerase [Candidatus Nucleicultricaceae bacterium]
MQTAFKIQPFDLNAFFEAELQEHQTVAKDTHAILEEPFIDWVEAAAESLNKGGKLIFIGNGGSAADAQHLATEFTVRYRTNRRPMAALALTTDTSTLTAIGNDFGFNDLFSRQIEALGGPNDLLIAITTSGKSPNIIEALKKAKSLGIKTVGLTGNTGGDLPGLCDILLVVPSKTTSRIQEMHIMLGQMLCGALEYRMGLIEG